MTLQDLKDQIETIALQHKQVNAFDYGEDFLLATGKGSEYPLVFLEIPYNISYEQTNRFKTVQFSLLVLNQPSLDDVVGDHQQISDMDVIADALITRVQSELPALGFRITNTPNGISLRNFSDDSVSGVRLDIQGNISRAFCKTGYADQFNIPD